MATQTTCLFNDPTVNQKGVCGVRLFTFIYMVIITAFRYRVGPLVILISKNTTELATEQDSNNAQTYSLWHIGPASKHTENYASTK